VRLVFLGTPDFAVPTLERIVAAGHEVSAVLTQPDRPKGRSQQVAAPPVKRAALRLGLPVHQPARIRTAETAGFLRSLAPDAMIVVGYGQIVPQAILDIPPHGILNVHASLLPKYRGAAPVQWAIANGETQTGVTTMRIDAGLDTGDILLQRETPIGPEETAIELLARLAATGADLLIETLAGLRNGTLAARKQDSSKASLAPILKKEDGRIDWTRPAAEIHNRVRGFFPWPGCHTRLRGKTLEIWKSRIAEPGAGRSGSVHAHHGRLLVSCGDATTLEILELQLEGRKKMSAAPFLNGFQLADNDLLGEMSE
jgi:methionyl-tRNA formyltransferase